MITLLRKIRKSLIDSGSGRRYLLYAIGEIALVVIGILIALQINNWNENLKINESEKKLLISLRDAMTADFKSQQRSIDWNESIQKSITIVLDHIDRDLSYHDSLNYHFAWATNAISFSIADSEYKNAELYGLHIFKYKETRNQLIRIHDRHLPLIEGMLEQQSNYYYQIAAPVYTELFASISKGGFGQEREMIPYDFELLKINKKYRNILLTSLNNRGREHYQMNYIFGILKDVVNLLNEEIEAR